MPVELEVALCRTSIPCRDYEAKFRVVRWGNEERVQHHKFPVRAWITVRGIPINHWNSNNLSKIFIKHAQILQISDSTLDKTELSVERLYVGCDDLDSVPKEISVIIGSRSYNVTTKIEAKIMEPAENGVIQED